MNVIFIDILLKHALYSKGNTAVLLIDNPVHVLKRSMIGRSRI